MNKIFCTKCGQIERVHRKFVPGERCSVCGSVMGINIKGHGELYLSLPNDIVKIPRRFRPTMKSGGVRNKSAVNGAKSSIGSIL